MLGTIRHLLEHPTTRREGVLRLGVLLKRTALAAWPRSEVASLSNADWAEFLANHGDTDTRTLEWLLTDFEYHDADAVAICRRMCATMSWRPRGPGSSGIMYQLELPWLLLVLPAPVLVWWLLPPHRETSASIRLPFFRR